MTTQRQNRRKPKLPPQGPRMRPDRKHAMPPTMKPTLKNLSDVMVYIWLKNGNSFWFYVSDCENNRLYGYAWIAGKWQAEEIQLQMVWSYY